MKRTVEWVLLSGLGLTVVLGSQSIAEAGDKATQGAPVIMNEEVISVVAAVESIDKTNRLLTLKDEAGEPFTVRVPDDVKNLDRLKKGDRIKLDYQQSQALAVVDSGKEEVADRTHERTGRLAAHKYGARRWTMTAEIQSVDLGRNQLTFKAPSQSHTATAKDPAVRARLGELKAGQTVQLTYTEPMAIRLEPIK